MTIALFLSATLGAVAVRGIGGGAGTGGASDSCIEAISSREPINSTRFPQSDNSHSLVVPSAHLVSQPSVVLSGRLDYSIISAYKGYQTFDPKLIGSMQPSGKSSSYSRYKKPSSTHI